MSRGAGDQPRDSEEIFTEGNEDNKDHGPLTTRLRYGYGEAGRPRTARFGGDFKFLTEGNEGNKESEEIFTEANEGNKGSQSWFDTALFVIFVSFCEFVLSRRSFLQKATKETKIVIGFGRPLRCLRFLLLNLFYPGFSLQKAAKKTKISTNARCFVRH